MYVVLSEPMSWTDLDTQNHYTPSPRCATKEERETPNTSAVATSQTNDEILRTAGPAFVSAVTLTTGLAERDISQAAQHAVTNTKRVMIIIPVGVTGEFRSITAVRPMVFVTLVAVKVRSALHAERPLSLTSVNSQMATIS